MQITSLEIVLAVAAVFIFFGPKRLPGSRDERSIKVEKERLPVRPTGHVTLAAHRPYAAGRAPSPLQQREVERQLPPVAGAKPQFAHGDKDSSPLPHEMLRV